MRRRERRATREFWDSMVVPSSNGNRVDSLFAPELVGYIEPMIMGDSLCAILDITEGGCWSAKEAERVIYGDNTAALAIVQSPSGPWRTRHLRLRSNVLRERVREGEWQIRHLPGSGLVADYLTKAVAAKTQWLWFYAMAGMIKDESEVVSRPGPGEADGGRVIGKEAAVKVAAMSGLMGRTAALVC